MRVDRPAPTGTASAELLDLELADPPQDEPVPPARPWWEQPGWEQQSSEHPSWQPAGDQQGWANHDSADGGEATVRMPGSSGEHLLQHECGTESRARRFYDDQVLDHLNPSMKEFVGRMDLAFIATADARGDCDSSLRAGPPGFVEVLSDYHLAYPEYRGNGVMASLGNISENPRIGILFVDFVTELIGLHVNGRARIVTDADLRAIYPALPAGAERGRTPERWVVVQVEEAYVHCRKHIPRMAPVLRERSWGTDEAKRKGGDFFGARATAKPWRREREQSGYEAG